MKESENTAKETFEGSGVGQNLPVIVIKTSLLRNGINVVEFLDATKILNSKSEIRRAINEKGFKINDIVLTDEKKIIHHNFYNQFIGV